MSGSNLSIAQKLLRALVIVLLLSAAYLYPFPQANVLYPAVVLVHAFVGIIATVLLVTLLWPLLRQGNWVWKAGWLLLMAGAVLGLVLLRTGTAHSEFRWLYAHIIASIGGISCLMAEWIGKRGWVSSNAAVRLGRHWLGCAISARDALAELLHHQESEATPGHYGRRRRRSARPVLPEFCASLRRTEDSEQVLHGV